MNYEVVWEMDAVEDRGNILEFLFEMAGERTAIATDEKFDSVAELLSVNPFLGVTWKGRERKLVIAKFRYLVFYYIDETESRVKIVRVLHSSKKHP